MIANLSVNDAMELGMKRIEIISTVVEAPSGRMDWVGSDVIHKCAVNIGNS